MAIWPTTLPTPLLNGYTIKPNDQTVRTDMDGGAARSRRRTMTRSDKVPVSWKFTDAQLVIFRAWFDDGVAGAAGGSAWFTTSLPTGVGGLTSITARFIGPFTAPVLSGLSWNVTAELELR